VLQEADAKEKLHKGTSKSKPGVVKAKEAGVVADNAHTGPMYVASSDQLLSYSFS